MQSDMPNMSLGSKMNRSISTAVAAMMLCISSVGNAAVIRVGTTDFYSQTACNLINAILSAETDSAVGGCAAGRGEDEIRIGGATYVLPTPLEGADAGLPVITTAIRIVGESATITKADNSRPVFPGPMMKIGPTGRLTGGNFTLDNGWESGLLIDGGSANLHDVTVSHQPVGGIAVHNGGRLTLVDSEVSHNRDGAYRTIGGIEVFNGSEVYLYNSVITQNSGGVGRGYNFDADEIYNTIHIENSEISENGSRYLGGIAADTSRLTLLNSTVTDGNAWYSGAITIGDYPSLIRDSVVADNYNTFGYAGGILAGAKTRIIDTTVRGNECSACDVGGIRAVAGAQIINTAVLSNTGRFVGGVLTDGRVTIRNSTIAGNTVKPFQPDEEKQLRLSGGIASKAKPSAYDLPIVMQNTIVADNIGGHWECAEDLLPESTSNFVSDGSCDARYAGASPFDMSAVQRATARYWPLRKNHVASIGGDVATCTENDMLGVSRLEDGVCSLGSVEYRAVIPPANPGNNPEKPGTGPENPGSTGTNTGTTGVLNDSGERGSGSKSGGGALSLLTWLLLAGRRYRYRRGLPPTN